MPLAMALATGIEAPSDAIAQLAQLGRRDRRLFGQWTIWLTVAIVGVLTLGIAGLAVALDVGLPPSDSTLLAEVARTSVGDGALFAAFQAASALLLLAAAASSYLAASGLLKALALVGASREDDGLVPQRFARTNRFHTPPWGIAVVLGASAGLIAAAAGRDQEIVQFYAVSVFAGFLAALLGCARLSLRDRRWVELVDQPARRRPRRLRAGAERRANRRRVRARRLGPGRRLPLLGLGQAGAPRGSRRGRDLGELESRPITSQRWQGLHGNAIRR